MSKTETFALKQAIASAALESKALTAELVALLEDAIKNNKKVEELLPDVLDGRS